MAENCLHKAYHHTLQCNCDELVVDLPFFLLLFFDCQENNEKKLRNPRKKYCTLYKTLYHSIHLLTAKTHYLEHYI